MMLIVHAFDDVEKLTKPATYLLLGDTWLKTALSLKKCVLFCCFVADLMG